MVEFERIPYSLASTGSSFFLFSFCLFLFFYRKSKNDEYLQSGVFHMQSNKMLQQSKEVKKKLKKKKKRKWRKATELDLGHSSSTLTHTHTHSSVEPGLIPSHRSPVPFHPARRETSKTE